MRGAAPLGKGLRGSEHVLLQDPGVLSKDPRTLSYDTSFYRTPGSFQRTPGGRFSKMRKGSGVNSDRTSFFSNARRVGCEPRPCLPFWQWFRQWPRQWPKFCRFGKVHKSRGLSVPLISSVTGDPAFTRTPGSFKKTPGSFRRTPGSFKRAGVLWRDPGILRV